MKIKVFSIVTVAGFFLSTQADTLSLVDYVKIALKNSPQQAITASTVDAGAAAVATTRSRLLPQVSANGGLSRSSGASSASTGRSGSSGTSTTAGISASTTIFDASSYYAYKASGKALDASRGTLDETTQGTLLNARSAYFAMLLNGQLLHVNEEALNQAKLHLDEANGLYEAGKTARMSVTKAKVDVANAEVNLIHAKNALKTARVGLETVAGKPFADPLVLTDSLDVEEDSVSLADALERALRNRPELIASRATVEGAHLQVKASKAAAFPTLSGSAVYDWRGTSASTIPAPDWSSPGWNFGIGLDVPLYQGGAIKAGVMSAEANVRKAEASLAAAELNIRQEVQQNYLSEIEARQRIGATATLIEQAIESLAMSQERYRNGIAASLEITDAELTLANARSSHLQAQFDYRVAHTKLLSAIGALHE
jgi:outer membrane protein